MRLLQHHGLNNIMMIISSQIDAQTIWLAVRPNCLQVWKQELTGDAVRSRFVAQTLLRTGVNCEAEGEIGSPADTAHTAGEQAKG